MRSEVLVEDIRARVVKAQHGRSVYRLAQEMGLAYRTLWAFLAGHPTVSLKTIQTIERWLTAEAGRFQALARDVTSA